MKKKVVITGMGILSPIGVGLDNFSNALKNGVSGGKKVTSFDVSEFASHIAGTIDEFNPEDYMEKKKTRKMARFTQMGMAAAKMAIKDSGLNTEDEDPRRIGVITGTGIGGLDIIEREHRNYVEKGPRRISPFLIPMIITNILPGEIAIEHGYTGPNFAITSACASATHAIGESLRMIRTGDADVMIAGGSEAAITPLGLGGFCSIKALTTRNDDPQKASRPFDLNRNGFLMGEGAGILVFESLEHAQKRGAKIYGELAGYGATDDAYHITAPNPEATSAVEAFKAAMNDAEVEPTQVDYVNAHGTSTAFNDKSETVAIKKAFGDHAYKLAISSTKSMTGHLLGAAGAVELIATLLSMKDGFIHPTINYETPDPECDLDYVPNTARAQQITCAMSNSLGFGGHNATVIVKKYEK